MTQKIPLVDDSNYRLPPEVEANLGGRDQTWQLVTNWQNGAHAWTGGGPWAVAAYRKDAEGLVRLRGLLSAVSNGTVFILPPGYRPLYAEMFPATVTELHGEVEVDIDGSVKITAPGTQASNWFSLSGICFQQGY